MQSIENIIIPTHSTMYSRFDITIHAIAQMADHCNVS